MDIIGLMPSFGGLIWTVVAFVLALSVVVAVHEYGHYIVGRWSGIHAEVFSLGFGPVLWSRRDKRGTRWQIAALPFGGYVKFLGDSDAASGKDSLTIHGLSEQEKARTMHGAPLWARAATVAAGPGFNFILSILVFSGFFLLNGVATDLPVVGKMKELPYSGQSLQAGDQILAVDGTETPDLSTFVTVGSALPPAATAEYRILRDGAELTVPGPYPLPPVADGVQAPSGANDAGMQTGDVVLSIDGTPISAFSELRTAVGASDGKPLLLTVWRDGRTFDVTLVPRRMDLPTAEGFETRWLIGLSGGLFFSPETRTPGPFEAIGLAAGQTRTIVTTSLSGLWHMITGAISSCNLQGPLGIAEVSGAAASQGAASFVWFIAMLSTAVGLMNLFPVPVLDGGHLVFHAFEAVTGKPPSDRVLRILMTGGLALLLGLMVFSLTNDLFC
ncbi:regulator of sigma E protease [Cereibacter changlensis]|uniref:Zinc metalloprotease n=2 Tax=Cereibacter changlensis TaxID=402884 RepID=A0A2W7RA01_9RHOB|nr:RIP metalloprotease RseP [Cereibacter changlensis]PZX57294.1 regulator of sigma E protease [Cereibacter changlensis]